MAVLVNIIIISCLITAEAFSGSGGSPPGVMLDSTLKQSSLCPGDELTTFTCTASGTELVWIVGGRTLSFNYNANVGTFRKIDENISAILMSIDNREDTGQDVLFSVLRVRVQPQATEMLSVACHNGTDHLAKEKQYLPRPADLPARPEMETTFDYKSRVANVSWTAPNNGDLNHYVITVDDDPPILTKNTSILYNLSSSNSESSVSLSLRVIDRCGQQGHTVYTSVEVISHPVNDPVMTDGVKKDCAGCLLLIMLMLLIMNHSLTI